MFTHEIPEHNTWCDCRECDGEFYGSGPVCPECSTERCAWCGTMEQGCGEDKSIEPICSACTLRHKVEAAIVEALKELRAQIALDLLDKSLHISPEDLRAAGMALASGEVRELPTLVLTTLAKQFAREVA